MTDNQEDGYAIIEGLEDTVIINCSGHEFKFSRKQLEEFIPSIHFNRYIPHNYEIFALIHKLIITTTLDPDLAIEDFNQSLRKLHPKTIRYTQNLLKDIGITILKFDTKRGFYLDINHGSI